MEFKPQLVTTINFLKYFVSLESIHLTTVETDCAGTNELGAGRADSHTEQTCFSA